MTERPRATWDQYFMNIAREVASRATCDRKHVGAVIVRDRCILATGYNGSIRGLEHCNEVGHMMEDAHCVRTIHAEANAIIQAARHGSSIDGATIYVTASPCWICFKMVANAGIERIVVGRGQPVDQHGAREDEREQQNELLHARNASTRIGSAKRSQRFLSPHQTTTAHMGR
jgi:dCMP deaminase